MTVSEEKLKENIQKIYATVEQTKKRDQEVQVTAITKYVGTEEIRQLYDAGIRSIGENRTQELLEKQQDLGEMADEIEWHFVGRLQRRPVKKMINQIDYLHSLDRMSLVKEVDKRAEKVIKCYLQVNVSGEEEKAGFAPEEVLDAVEAIAEYPNIQIIGLMTMAPYEAEEEELHHIFYTLRQLQEEVAAMNISYAPCNGLSMGMSRDYPIAIEEGATIIRVGSAFFEE